MFRYLGLLWNAESMPAAAGAEGLKRRIQALTPAWKLMFTGTGVAVLATDCSRHSTAQSLDSGRGIILGEIFPRPNSWDSEAPAKRAQTQASDWAEQDKTHVDDGWRRCDCTELP